MAPAIALLDSVEREAERLGDATARREAVLQRGSAYVMVGQARPAELQFRRGLSLSAAAHDTARLASTHGWLGMSLMYQGRFPDAMSAYRQALQLNQSVADSATEAWARTGLSYCLLQMGDLQGARTGYLRALELFRGLHDGSGELQSLNGLGIVELQGGQFAAAAARYRAIIGRSRSLGEPASEAQAWNNLGSIEFQSGDPTLAVEHYRRAIAIHRSRGEIREIVTSQHNVAVALLDLGHREEAVAILDSALAECERNGFLEGRARILHRLGHAHLLAGRTDEAVAVGRRALEETGSLSVEAHARAVCDLAQTLVAAGRGDSARMLLDRESPALRARLGLRDRLDLEVAHGDVLVAVGETSRALAMFRAADREAEGSGLVAQRLHPLAAQARCEAALGDTAAATATLRTAAAVWERQRAVPSDPEWRAERGARGREIFADLAFFVLHGSVGDIEERGRRAFDLVQPFKARTLFERCTGPGAAGAPSPEAPAISLTSVQHDVLRPGELLLDVFLGTERGLLFAVTRDELRVVELPGAAALERRLRDLRDLLRRPTDDADTRTLLETAGRGLGTTLFGEVADLVASSRRVLFAPDGALNTVPVAVLQVPGRDGRSLRLAERECANIPSIALLAALRNRPRGAPSSPAILALGPGSEPGGRALAGAAHEVSAIRGRFSGVEIGRESDAPLALRGQILHVAGHTDVDDQRPWRSSFALATARAGEVRRLSAAEVLNRDLDGRLAVLAGCESAGGRVFSGEGVQGLTAAFMGAGIPAVVASLWRVDDRATERLVTALYSELARGRSVAASLRSAQERVRRDTATAAPFYWAGFVVVGDPDVTVTLRTRPPWALWLMVAASIALPFLVIGLRRRGGGAA